MAKKPELTGDNYPHTKRMSLSEWEAFSGNFTGGIMLKHYLLDRQHDSFPSFLQGAFVWSKTPQGHDYWSKIYDRNNE